MTTPPQLTSALFRALRHAEVDPELAHEAVEEMHHEAGQNIIAVLGAKTDALRAEILGALTALRGEFRGELTAHSAKFDAIDSRMDRMESSLGSRLDRMESSFSNHVATLNKIVWTLTGILGTAVLGLLYRLLVVG